MTALPRDQPSSAHMTLSIPAFPELRAWAVEGRLDLDLLLGYDVFSMRGVSLAAATQMFSAQVRGGALWASTRSLRDAARCARSKAPCLSLRPDHAGLGCRFVLSFEDPGQAVELDARHWAEALALFARGRGMEVQGINLSRPLPRRRHRRPDAYRLIPPSSRPGA